MLSFASGIGWFRRVALAKASLIAIRAEEASADHKRLFAASSLAQTVESRLLNDFTTQVAEQSKQVLKLLKYPSRIFLQTYFFLKETLQTWGESKIKFLMKSNN